MPQYYLIPKRLARRFPRLESAVQWLESLPIRGVFWCVDRLSPERAARVAGACFRLVGPHTPKAKKAEVNLAVAFPDKAPEWRRETVREIFRHLGIAAAELIKLEQIWQERERRLSFELSPGARELIERGGPAVYVCAHVGAWQLTNLIARRYDLRISTVYAEESNPAMRDTLQRLRAAFGVNLVSTAAGIRPLIKELKAGHSVGMAMDTRLDTGTLLPFFGREALTNTTAARLALKTGAALVPIHCRRLGNARFAVSVYEPLQSRVPEAPEDEQALDLSRQINQHFEAWIRETPGQWICLKRRWPKAHKL